MTGHPPSDADPKRSSLTRLLVVAARLWIRARAPAQSAALAFYTLVALGPVLAVTIAIAGSIFGEEATRGEIATQIESLLGPVTARAVVEVLDSADRPSHRGLTGVIGVVALILGATAVFNQLQEALTQVFAIEPAAKKVRRFLLRRLLSFGLVLSIGCLLLLSLVLNAAVAAVRSYVVQRQDGVAFLFPSLDFLATFLLITALLALIYRTLPGARVSFQDVTLGAFFTATLFSVGKFAIGAYLGRSNYLSVYGVAGSVVLSLLWIYYSWMVLLAGASFTRAWTLRKESEDTAATS